MSLEEWKTGLDWTAIILTGLTVFSGAAPLIVGNRLSDIKDGQLRKFSKDLTDTRGDVATQQIRAAEAERRLLELQERVKPRRLTDDQRTAFVNVLRGLPYGVVKVGHTAGGADEALHLAQQVLPLFKQAGWVAPEPAGMSYRVLEALAVHRQRLRLMNSKRTSLSV
jgi:hypothetical protein